MEVLIPGLILVALMVYASTRIKKMAAAAFAAETIETDEFIIQKPEGFLHNLNGDPKYIFEAYSRDLSKVNNNMRTGTVTLTRIENTTLEAVVNEMPPLINQILDENKYSIFTLNKTVDSVATQNSYKLAERDGRVYKLEITVVGEPQNTQWVETFFDSFRVK